jgi:putative hydrolase of the HAD superfamily
MLAIIFDVDDTLYDQMIPFKVAYQTCFGHQYQISTAKLYNVYRRCSDEVFDASQRGEITMEKMYIYRIQKAMLELGVSISDEDALIFQEVYAQNQKKIHLSDDMKELLLFCQKRKIQMGIISNGPAAHQRSKIASLELERWISPHNIFVSGELDVMKPDVKIFQIVEERLQLSKEFTYFVGDSFNNDIVGAKNAGWNAIWLDRRGVLPSLDSIHPDHQVKSEGELIGLLHRLVT